MSNETNYPPSRLKAYNPGSHIPGFIVVYCKISSFTSQLFASAYLFDLYHLQASLKLIKDGMRHQKNAN